MTSLHVIITLIIFLEDIYSMNGFLLNLKFKRICKAVVRNIKLFFSLPHLIITLAIIILAIITLLFSIDLHISAPFASSVLSNVFAGLVTGVVLCLISSVKAVSLYKTERIITWLKELNSEFLNFNKLHHQMLFDKKDNFESDDKYYDFIYDVLCAGNCVTTKISQGQFDVSLPFNSYKYCKRHLKYDAIAFLKKNEKIREIVLDINSATITQQELRKIFNDMENSLFELNGRAISKIKELEAKKKVLSSSLI